MKLKHIEVFNAIMITGTASAAAELLYVSQSAVTQTLQHAELQLGYQLFSRQRNRLVPTSEAHALYPEVQKVMLQIESVKRLAQALKGGQEMQLRVLIVPSLAVKVLPAALSVFRKKFPKMSISIRTLHSNEIAKAIALQEGDVGVVYGSQPHPGLIEERIAVGNLVYLTQADKKNNRNKTVFLEDVIHRPFLRIDERDPLGALLATQWSRMGYAPQGGITVQTHHIAMVLAEEGFGPAIVDSFTASALGENLDSKVLLPEVPVEICALIPQGVRSANPVAYFIEAIKGVTAAL